MHKFSNFAFRRALAIGLMGSALTVGTLWVFVGSSHSGSDPRLHPLLVPQSSVAEDSGIRIEALGATFSGSGTWVQLDVTLTPSSPVDAAKLANVVIPTSLIGSGGLTPLDAGDGLMIRARGDGPTILRLAPYLPPQEPTVRILGLDVYLTSGEVRRISGDWQLKLTPPSDLEAAMRLERLTSARPSQDNGIEVALLSAARTGSETSFVVQIESATPVVLLSEPRLLADGKTLVGGVATQRERGAILELVFPPTKFGSDVTLVLGPFVRANAQTDVFTDVDMAEVLTRAIPGDSGRLSAPVLPADIRSPADGMSPVRSVEVGSVVLNGEQTDVMQLELAGNFELAGDQTVIFDSGLEERAISSSSGYRKLPGGDILQGTTTLLFRLGSRERWAQTVRIFHGNGTEILRGSWHLAASPEQAQR